MNLFDLMTTINNLPADCPNFEASNFDADKVAQLLKQLDKPWAFDSRCKEPETTVLCSFENKTYLIDEEMNLWDINADGDLSVLSVGVVSSGVSGFAADIAKNIAASGDIDALADVSGMLTEEYIECLTETMDEEE